MFEDVEIESKKLHEYTEGELMIEAGRGREMARVELARRIRKKQQIVFDKN